MDEACDDGNTVSDDGCSDSCEVESDYTCSVAASPKRFNLPATFRDFRQSHVDFELMITGMYEATLGIVQDVLDEEGKPALTAAGDTLGPIDSEDSFSQWYRDVDGVNASIEGAVTLWRTEDGAYVNRYEEDGDPWVLPTLVDSPCVINSATGGSN